jgi:ditrans,polycis-polyprenyl diphosphate synthase
VDGLLDLARDKFRCLLEERDRLREHGVRVRVIGNVYLLPSDLQALIAEAEEATRENGERTLNVAFSYTSREEITQVCFAFTYLYRT